MNRTALRVSVAAALLAICAVTVAQAADLQPYSKKGKVVQRLKSFDNPEGAIFSADGKYVFISNSAELGMADKGFHKGWGLLRHVLGSNYSHYVRDPWGSYFEYTCDIDYIPATHDWEAGRHPAEDSIYLWGPPLPEDFIVNYEAFGERSQPVDTTAV